jgi:hypothetical protein
VPNDQVACTRLCTRCIKQTKPNPIYFQVYLFKQRAWCDTEIVGLNGQYASSSNDESSSVINNGQMLTWDGATIPASGRSRSNFERLGGRGLPGSGGPDPVTGGYVGWSLSDMDSGDMG